MENLFCGNTKELILKEMAQWQVEGEISGDEDLDQNGCFYIEAQSEIQTALLQGGFPANFTTSTPIAMNYIAAIHRKLTSLLYIQARRINIITDGQDASRGLWWSIRKKLNSISKGEPFGELSTPKGSVNCATFYCSEPYSERTTGLI